MKTGFFCKHFFYILFSTLFILSSLFPNEINNNIFAKRRQLLMTKMAEGIAILKGAQTSLRNGDVDYEFRQNSDFYYLTGFEEPNAALIILPGKEKKFILFITPGNPLTEIWTGRKSTIREAMEIFSADTAYPISSFDQMIGEYLNNIKKIYMNFSDKELRKKIDAKRELEVISTGNKEFDARREYAKLNLLIAEMRIIKDDGEISLIKKACEITAEGYNEILRIAKPRIYEYELEAILDFVFKKNGAEYHAFPPIIASGKNSLTLHYEQNKARTEKNNLILLDIGAEYRYYAADVSRTFPIDGRFTTEQKQIYEIVLNAQKAGISYAKKGIGFNEFQDSVSAGIAEGLLSLGLITDKYSAWQLNVWMPHSASHMLGLDVHDVGDVGYFDPKGRLFEPGMIFTAEPGIYINSNVFDNLSKVEKNVSKEEIDDFIYRVKPVAEKFKDIGIRIEDDVLITENGNEVLSKAAPKEINEIEELMHESGKIFK